MAEGGKPVVCRPLPSRSPPKTQRFPNEPRNIDTTGPARFGAAKEEEVCALCRRCPTGLAAGHAGAARRGGDGWLSFRRGDPHQLYRPNGRSRSGKMGGVVQLRVYSGLAGLFRNGHPHGADYYRSGGPQDPCRADPRNLAQPKISRSGYSARRLYAAVDSAHIHYCTGLALDL